MANIVITYKTLDAIFLTLAYGVPSNNGRIEHLSRVTNLGNRVGITIEGNHLFIGRPEKKSQSHLEQWGLENREVIEVMNRYGSIIYHSYSK